MYLIFSELGQLPIIWCFDFNLLAYSRAKKKNERKLCRIQSHDEDDEHDEVLRVGSLSELLLFFFSSR